MIGKENSKNENSKEAANSSTVSAPSISLPKGGGAIRGIGEKFAANPVTGTGSLNVPIAVTPGRSGFSPQLSLSYDSGSGNGPFGFGWNLSIPSITRKTDKGLPKYEDANESDVFILSGAEDLVPTLVFDNDSGGWKRETFDRTLDDVVYTVQRYRPRTEGLFARIEKWTNNDNDDIHWRSISKENITTIYGKDDKSRIFDPDDPLRIFQWLISESYDDKGNAIMYEYVPEDSTGIDLSLVHEKNRTNDSRSANRYLKRIKYGNKTTRLLEPDLSLMNWMFELVFDYGDGHYFELHVDADGRQYVRACIDKTGTWPVRRDPFSTYRAGFEVRTYRLCRRVLMFHHFNEELGREDYLVRSTEFTYRQTPVASFIESVTQSGYVVRGDEGNYLKKSMPPLEFTYSEARIDDTVHTVDKESLENLPMGLDGGQYQWVDLDGEGLSGILTQQGDAWYYKANRGNAQFEPMQPVAVMPASANLGAGQQQFMDLAGDGQLDLVQFSDPLPGFYERTEEEGWEQFRSFQCLPNIDWNDPNLKFVDLNGDGHADILISEDHVFTWLPSLAEQGFGASETVLKRLDEEKGPALVFADGTQSVYLSDISGDSLPDIARIRRGEVCYWPNLGYGRFGAKVTMDHSPWFDRPDQFDQKRIRLADIDGSGTTDIIYLGREQVSIYFNESGNSWSEARHLAAFPRVDNLAAVTAADLKGNGTACLVCSSFLDSDKNLQMRYIDLMGGQKPHLLIKTVNNLGTETRVQYAPSTKFYLADKLAGKPWVTRLPFPVHCVEKVSVTDTWRQTTFSTQYTYHHGYFDGIEREFRGFGRVEQVDVETYGEFARGNEASPYISGDKTLYQPPVKTITWFHTGAFLHRECILNQFQEEYFPNWLNEAGFSIDEDYSFAERALPEPDLTHLDLSTREWREALRACKGMTLRREVYELDVDALEEGRHVPTKLFTAAVHNCQIRRIQPGADNRYAVFLVTESEALSYHYELDLREPLLCPDPRITHTLVLKTNEYGQPLQQAAVAYPRVRDFTEGADEESPLPTGTEELIRRVQAELHVGYTETRYTKDVELDDHYRLRMPYQVSTFELTGIGPEDEDDRATTGDPWDDIYFTLEELRRFRLSEIYQIEGTYVETIPYHHLPTGAAPRKRLAEQARTLYFDENLVDFLPLGELNHLGLPYETYTLALTDDLLDAILREKLEGLVEEGETYADAVGRILRSGGYYRWDSQWWTRSGIAGFAADAADHFYLPERYIDPFNQVTELTFDPYDIYIRQTSDPVGSTTSVENFDFRVMAPAVMKDPNDNLSAAAFDTLGLPVETAVMGKNGTESGDRPAEFREEPSIDELTAFFTNEDYDETRAREWLGPATARFVYYFGEEQSGDGSITYGNHPACACGILREKHVNQLETGEPGLIHAAFEYSDGSGQVLVTKTRAEPGTAGGPMRWLAAGKTILNNKGKPVKQYEPYFSESGHCFEEPLEAGVTPVMYYDAVGRLVRTELPDGSYSRVEFSPWFMAAYDPNDTVLEPDNTWYERNSATDASLESQRAARLTAVHANTPAVTHLDSLGREVLAVAHNRRLDDSGEEIDEKIVTFTKLDAEGKPLWIRDARGNLVMQYITPPAADHAPGDPGTGFAPCYDIAGNLLFQHSMDAGDRWILNDITGQPLYSWDSRNNILRTAYDPLRRPVTSELRNDTHADWIVVGCTRYGDEPGLTEAWEADARARNLRGQAYRTYDQSGLVTNVNFDFKGNPLQVQRRLALEYENDIDWDAAVTLAPEVEPDGLLMDETFSQIFEYDALNRVTRQYNWHKSTGSRVAVVEPRYNRRGLLEQEDVVPDATKTDEDYEGGTPTAMVRKITYNEKGQRLGIEYGNGTTTTYTYDPETFRLVHMETRRHTDGKILQDLWYTYDPVGNITEIIDNAQPTVFFNNFHIDARNRYTYDALYRLIRAEGREHAGQVVHGEHDNWHDCAFKRRYHPNERMAWRNYTEHYRYDSVGNILSVRHTAHEDTANSWTRQYQYGQADNRLLATGMGSGPVGHYPAAPTLDYRYSYNVHGSMTAMSHLQTMAWDFTEHLQHIARTAWSQGEGENPCPDPSLQAWYRYDAGKQRTRKRVQKQGELVEERFYLGGIEVFRKYDCSETLTLERETLHVMDDQQRIAIVETKTVVDGVEVASPDAMFRYQLNNHLGSSSLELDEEARVISYEEYHPYGSTSCQAVSNAVEVNAKRYRYTGMERDEETGFNYHTARYYAPWLGRWVSCDPAGLLDGMNLYVYTGNNPINSVDYTGMFGDPPRPGRSTTNREQRRRMMQIQTQPAPSPIAASLQESPPIPSPTAAHPHHVPPPESPSRSAPVQGSESSSPPPTPTVDSSSHAGQEVRAPRPVPRRTTRPRPRSRPRQRPPQETAEPTPPPTFVLPRDRVPPATGRAPGQAPPPRPFDMAHPVHELAPERPIPEPAEENVIQLQEIRIFASEPDATESPPPRPLDMAHPVHELAPVRPIPESMFVPTATNETSDADIDVDPEDTLMDDWELTITISSDTTEWGCALILGIVCGACLIESGPAAILTGFSVGFTVGDKIGEDIGEVRYHLGPEDRRRFLLLNGLL